MQLDSILLQRQALIANVVLDNMDNAILLSTHSIISRMFNKDNVAITSRDS